MNAKITNRRILPNVLNDINAERMRQHKLWGIQNHADYKWLAILTEEVGEAAKEALEADAERNAGFLAQAKQYENNMREELVQVAAVAIAFIEAIDRRS